METELLYGLIHGSISEHPPPVIHIRIGIVLMRDFHRVVGSVWDDALAMSREDKLVTVFKGKLETVN